MKHNVDNTSDVMSATLRVRLASWLASQGVVGHNLVVPGDTFDQFTDRLNVYVQSIPKQDRLVWDDAFFDSRTPQSDNEGNTVSNEREADREDLPMGSAYSGAIKSWVEPEDEDSEANLDN